MKSPGDGTSGSKESRTGPDKATNRIHAVTAIVTALFVVGVFVAALSGLLQIWVSFGKHGVPSGQFAFRVVVLLIYVPLLFLAWNWTATGQIGRADRRPTLLRLFLYILLAALVGTSVFFREERPADDFMIRSFFLSAWLAAGIAWMIAALCWNRVSRLWDSKIVRACELLLFQLFVAALLLEGSLWVYASYSTSPLFTRNEEALEYLKQTRKLAGLPRFDITMNSDGFFDEEFYPGEEDALVVAVLADSFGVGTVPHAYNFTSVAERKLAVSLSETYDRFALHNFGIANIGMPAYIQIFMSEARVYQPDLVIVCIFVGNDVREAVFHNDSLLIQDRWIWLVPKRLLSLTREQWTGGNLVRVGRGKTVQSDTPIPKYVKDPAKEEPTFSLEAFLDIERGRLNEAFEPEGSESVYEDVFKGLMFLKKATEDRLMVVLIPDEFQVNDELWRTITGDRGYERDRPQKIITAFCVEKGISLLDLLPALRSAEKQGRSYRLQDTHWNARGNRVAGERISEAIVGWLRGEGTLVRY